MESISFDTEWLQYGRVRVTLESHGCELSVEMNREQLGRFKHLLRGEGEFLTVEMKERREKHKRYADDSFDRSFSFDEETNFDFSLEESSLIVRVDDWLKFSMSSEIARIGLANEMEKVREFDEIQEKKKERERKEKAKEIECLCSRLDSLDWMKVEGWLLTAIFRRVFETKDRLSRPQMICRIKELRNIDKEKFVESFQRLLP